MGSKPGGGKTAPFLKSAGFAVITGGAIFGIRMRLGAGTGI
jgi:uncharacterized membrane protein YedE/YeeE